MPDVMVPVQPLIAEGAKPFAMFVDHRKYPWMLPVYKYKSQKELPAVLPERVTAPAEAKAREVRAARLWQAAEDEAQGDEEGE